LHYQCSETEIRKQNFENRNLKTEISKQLKTEVLKAETRKEN